MRTVARPVRRVVVVGAGLSGLSAALPDVVPRDKVVSRNSVATASASRT